MGTHLTDRADHVGITGLEFMKTDFDELEKKVRKNIQSNIKALDGKTREELHKELASVKRGKNMSKYGRLTSFAPQKKLRMVVEYLKNYQKAIEDEIKRREKNK